MEKQKYVIDVRYIQEDEVYLATSEDMLGFIIQGDDVDETLKEAKLMLASFFEDDKTLPSLETVEFEFNIEDKVA